MGAAWLVSFGVEYVVALQYTATDEHYQLSWEKSFMPLPPWSNPGWASSIFYKFMLVHLNRTDLVLAYVFVGLAIIGAASLFARSRSLALLVTLPFVVTLAASALHKYPLSYRFMLFLIPLTFLLMADGLAALYRFAARWNRGLAMMICGLAAITMLGYPIAKAVHDLRTPQSISEIRPIVAYVAENRQEQDVVYVYYGAVTGFMYYAPFYQFGSLESENVIMGAWRQSERKALERFFEDAGGLKGIERVWFVFSGIADCGGCEGDKRVFFTDYLNERGTMLDQVEDLNTGAYLYRLDP
jgi:hypothetical protein